MKKSFRESIVMLVGLLFSLCSLPSCQKEKINAGDNHPPAPQVPSLPAPVSMVLSAIARPINDNIGGYYIGLPSNYSQTAQSYPLLLYMHGAGQFGNGSSDLPLLLRDGVAQVISDKKFPGSITINNQSFSFVVLMPQTKNFPNAADINECIELAKKSWRIDSRRIYLSGLSAGSMASCDYAADNTSKIAALVPMAGVPSDYSYTNICQKMVAGHLPVWVFHSQDDPQVSVSIAKGFVAKMASLNPGIRPKLTIWPGGGHDAWTRAVNPSYRESGKNIYEWMLQYHR
jgi:predicted peptidase